MPEWRNSDELKLRWTTAVIGTYRYPGTGTRWDEQHNTSRTTQNTLYVPGKTLHVRMWATSQPFQNWEFFSFTDDQRLLQLYSLLNKFILVVLVDCRSNRRGTINLPGWLHSWFYCIGILLVLYRVLWATSSSSSSVLGHNIVCSRQSVSDTRREDFRPLWVDWDRWRPPRMQPTWRHFRRLP